LRSMVAIRLLHRNNFLPKRRRLARAAMAIRLAPTLEDMGRRRRLPAEAAKAAEALAAETVPHQQELLRGIMK